MPTEFHIGIDDTDSSRGGCTTYTAAVLYQRLCENKISPSDFPWLVRLNPNIPWKTRGNGALAIHLLADEDQIEVAKRLAVEIVAATSDTSAHRTDPAVVFLKGKIPEILREYSNAALHNVLSIRQARKVLRETAAEAHLLKGKRGLIGSLAAIGAGLDHVDHTFEIIAYRRKENLGTPRRVDRESIKLMNEKFSEKTFHNLDPESGRILICPHGPDPVLLGIRGFSPNDLQEAFAEVRIEESVERIMIFRTNQGTDAHLTKTRRIADLEPHQSTILQGRVDTLPRVQRGGHVIFQMRDDSGQIDCAAYAPTGSLMIAARNLLPGDQVKLYGGVRRLHTGRLTLNLEKIEILQLQEKTRRENPLCSICQGRCESLGRGQGWRCKKCGFRSQDASPVQVRLPRNLSAISYVPVTGARRHLTSPHLGN